MRGGFFGAMLVAALLGGCAAADEDTPDESGAAVRGTDDVAGAFAVQYALGGDFDRIAERDAPAESELRATLACVAQRRDLVRGATARLLRWTFERRRYFVLEVDLEDQETIRDAVFVYVFSESGATAFQALAWDGKKNVKLAFRTGTGCPT